MDEYIAIAKEKHGYNVEQVWREVCVCVCVCTVCAGARPHVWACRGLSSSFLFIPKGQVLLCCQAGHHPAAAGLRCVPPPPALKETLLRLILPSISPELGIPSRRGRLLLERSALCKWVSGRSLHGAALEVSGTDLLF